MECVYPSYPIPSHPIAHPLLPRPPFFAIIISATAPSTPSFPFPFSFLPFSLPLSLLVFPFLLIALTPTSCLMTLSTLFFLSLSSFCIKLAFHLFSLNILLRQSFFWTDL